ncbi:hypothetical protein [Paenibacillus sp. Aloe-11]|uniref:hypothetical protein n=1 Tax=Paenibacillus sp. Aloe-11 TaxID=1050222 RepID=UPI0005C5BD3E|nr:hypothetical protein [Paenibacillus sp. Aloe-11]
MNGLSLTTIVGIFGAAIGGALGIYISSYTDIVWLSYIIRFSLAALFGSFFSFLGWYLNKKGLLVNIFQFINLLVGLLLFYLLFCVVSFIVLSFTPISKELINIYGTYVPIPLSFLAIIRYIKKKKIKFKKSYDTIEDDIYY